jgi:hypothetical protein
MDHKRNDDTELEERRLFAERGCSTINFEGGLSGTPSRYGTVNWIELPLIDEISDAESLMNDNYLYLTR